MFFDMGNLKPSIYNALMILAVVIVLVPLTKYAANRFPVPGLTPLVNAI